MAQIVYGTASDASPAELVDFYRRLHHNIAAEPEKIGVMLARSAAVVTARRDGELVGLARGVSDGVRGYLTECKLDPALQGPAAVTRTDGRIEHDTDGIAAEMARRVLQVLFAHGAERVDALAWTTEEDFLADLGFRRAGGLVGMTLQAGAWSAPADASVKGARGR